jgi:Fe-S cluster biogenesis protein NfuA
MFIQTEETPNPQTLKFIPGTDVTGGESVEFVSADDVAGRSPLAGKLFTIDGVKSVFLGYDFVAVTKRDDANWQDIRTYILGALFECFSMGQPVLVASADNTNQQDLSETAKKIIELIDTRIRPAVARDGGDIVFQKFEKGIVWLQMRGACSGCPSASITLKMGIENMLRNFIPEVLEVRAVEE